MILHVNTCTCEMERKKERKTPEANEKMKNELPQVGFEPTTLCTPDRCTCTFYSIAKHNINICSQISQHYNKTEEAHNPINTINTCSMYNILFHPIHIHVLLFYNLKEYHYY